MQRVFLVDDDPDVRKALCRTLREEGWSVDTFASAEEFLRRPDSGAYGCLVLDVMMPGLNGLELQRQLLDAVVPRLAPSGVLVYSVCTFTRAEGPDQIVALVARTGLRLVAEHRSWPPDADAFYIARLERQTG